MLFGYDLGVIAGVVAALVAAAAVIIILRKTKAQKHVLVLPDETQYPEESEMPLEVRRTELEPLDYNEFTDLAKIGQGAFGVVDR